MDHQWLTPDEAADYLRVSKATLYRWERGGIGGRPEVKLRSYRLGPRSGSGGRRYKRDELDALFGVSQTVAE